VRAGPNDIDATAAAIVDAETLSRRLAGAVAEVPASGSPQVRAVRHVVDANLAARSSTDTATREATAARRAYQTFAVVKNDLRFKR
jgi:hypothetical protein